jgi:hypothetical protein
LKKALVLAIVMVLGLGVAGFAQGVLEGVWDTDISLYPAAGEFGDFIKSFTSEVDIDFTLGCFTFGVETTFGLAGLTGMDFGVEGTLGAFTLSGDIAFSPAVIATTETAYLGLELVSSCLTGVNGLSWTKKTVTNTYTAAFDYMELVGSVSIAGVDLEALFYLDGVDETSFQKTGLFGTVVADPTGQTFGDDGLVQTGTVTVFNSLSNGAGWRVLASGSCGGATLTGRVYFNLADYWGSHYGAYGLDYPLSYHFAESGDWSIVCDDCISRFTGLQVLAEDLSFACVNFSAMASFDCCGFNSVKFLIEDIGLGCCWDIGFDMMVTFTTLSKTLTIDPSITLANSCFTISAGLDFDHDGGGAGFSLDGIEIYGIGLEYAFNGVTFTSKTSWNLSEYPILGPGRLGGRISSPTKIYALQPDLDFTDVIFTYDEATGTCTADVDEYAVDETGLGFWEVTSFDCERAYAWEMFGIGYEADACCGGAFSASASFYFGDIMELTDLDGSYYTTDVAVELTDDLTLWLADHAYDFFGDGYYVGTGSILLIGDFADLFPGFSAAGVCDCCPCDEADCSFPVDLVKWDAKYTDKANNRLFDWVETDVDMAMGLGSNFELTFGLDVTCWGWEDFTFGFEFTF